MTPQSRRGARGAHGVAAVELALVLPLLFLFLAGAVDLGRGVMIRAQLHEAAEEAVIYAARYPDRDVAEAKQVAIDAVSAITLPAGDITVDCDDATNRVTVDIVHQHDTVFLGFGGGDLDIAVTLISDKLSKKACS